MYTRGSLEVLYGLEGTLCNARVWNGGPFQIMALRLIFVLRCGRKHMARRNCIRCKKPRVQKPSKRICSYCRNNSSPPKKIKSTTKENKKRAKNGDKIHTGWVTHVRAKGPRDEDGKLLNRHPWKDQYIDKYGNSEFNKCYCIVGEPYFADGVKKNPLTNCEGIKVSAHVTLKKSNGSGDHFIVPMCKKHNDGHGGQIIGGLGIQYSVKVSRCIAMRAIRE